MESSTFAATTAAAALALGCSVPTLHKLRRAGILRPGVHFRPVGVGSARPRLRWDVAATDAALTARAVASGDCLAQEWQA
jgi:hypothetical protein